MDIAKVVQIAMLGETPATLRFVYVSLIESKLNFHAVFAQDATEEHLESASRVITEIFSACPQGTVLQETIEINAHRPWKIDDGKNLMYLRFGELSGL